MNYVFIFISIVSMTAGQLLVKKGVNLFGQSPHNISDLFRLFFKAPSNVYIISAVVLTIITVLSWMQVLSKMELSYAYPFMALSYVFVALFSMWLFNDHMSIWRWAGVGVICLGVFLISRS